MNKYWENLSKRPIWKSFTAFPAATSVLLQTVEFFSNHLDINPGNADVFCKEVMPNHPRFI